MRALVDPPDIDHPFALQARRGRYLARTLAPGRSLLTVPLGQGAVYCYADIATGNSRPPGDWRRYFDDFGHPITQLLDQAGQAYGRSDNGS